MYVMGVTCGLIILLFQLYDRLPTALNSVLIDVLSPGFFFTLLINGSLHDRVIPGYVAIAGAFDCILYSLLALGVSKLLALWKSD
jgi:hypothetical protein